jgi:nucleolar protein 4
MAEHHDVADVVVSNVPADATADEIEELYADAGPVRRVAMKRNGKAILQFVLATDAQRCLEDMGGRTLRGQTLSLSVHSVEEQVPTIKHEPVNTRLFRLIVRNLPFGVKEAAVRSVFQDFGRLVEVHLPTKAGPDGKPMGRGFGFLQYSTKKEAKEALERGNAIEVLGRPVAVDWALGKEFYEAAAGPAKPAAAAAKRAAGEAELEAGTAKRKPAAADGDKEKSTGAAVTGTGAAKRRRVDDGGDAADAGKAGAKAGKAGKGKRGEESEDATAEEEEPAETTAVFVRNVPLEATEEELAAVGGGGG